MNTYVKYMPGVFLAKSNEAHFKGDKIIVTTSRGKEIECIVFNLIANKEDRYYYSVVRADGFNAQEWAKRRAERYEKYAVSAQTKSEKFYEKSQEHAGFLSLGEPIKIGHHSERRHRRIIEQSDNNMRKSVEFKDKISDHIDKSEYWKSRANDINLSMPESLEYFEHKLEEAKIKHEQLKSGKIERSHSFSLTYAKKEVNDLTKKLDIAKKLWD